MSLKYKSYKLKAKAKTANVNDVQHIDIKKWRVQAKKPAAALKLRI